jgi:hypothetical protein
MVEETVALAEVEPFRRSTAATVSDAQVRDLLYGRGSGVELVLTGSGKGALAAVLRYFRSVGRLENKNTPVMVPRWLGSWVYNVMLKWCFPDPAAGPRTAGLLIYHQYGYPQDLDVLLGEASRRGWFVVEDCAHAVRSYRAGQRLGLIGDAGILSFSKFFPSLTGGAVITRNRELATFVRRLRDVSPLWMSAACFWAKRIYESSARGRVGPRFAPLVEMTYGVYDRALAIDPHASAVIGRELRGYALDRRDEVRDRYLAVLGDLGCFPAADAAEVTPYVLPVLGQESALERLAARLRDHRVRTGVYHFDVRRNHLEPDFRPCVWLPVHPGVPEQLQAAIADEVRRQLG